MKIHKLNTKKHFFDPQSTMLSFWYKVSNCHKNMTKTDKQFETTPKNTKYTEESFVEHTLTIAITGYQRQYLKEAAKPCVASIAPAFAAFAAFAAFVVRSCLIPCTTVFIDLTAAYDTVWHRGLTCKLLRLLPDKHMVKMIMELVRNRSFTLTTGDSKQSRLRRLKNGVPQ